MKKIHIKENDLKRNFNDNLEPMSDYEKELMQGLDLINSDEKKKEIIDGIIDRIEVTKIEPHHFKIVVKNKTGYLQDYIFDYRTTGHKIHVEEIISKQIKVDITPSIAKYKRFERKRFEKR